MNQSLDGLYYEQPEGFGNETDLYVLRIGMLEQARLELTSTSSST